MTRKNFIIVFSLIAALAVLTVSSLIMGRYSAPITEQLRVLFGLPNMSIDAEHRADSGAVAVYDASAANRRGVTDRSGAGNGWDNIPGDVS